MKEIYNSTFEGCTNLKTINIPSSVSTIGLDAFKGTQWLEDKKKESTLVTVNNILIDGTSYEGEELIIPDNVETIGEGAFADCTSLEKITLPNSITTLGHGTFSNCTNLKEINLPKNLKVLPSYIFRECTSLKKIDLPSSVTETEPYSFIGCSSLEEVSLPKGFKT